MSSNKPLGLKDKGKSKKVGRLGEILPPRAFRRRLFNIAGSETLCEKYNISLKRSYSFQERIDIGRYTLAPNEAVSRALPPLPL